MSYSIQHTDGSDGIASAPRNSVINDTWAHDYRLRFYDRLLGRVHGRNGGLTTQHLQLLLTLQRRVNGGRNRVLSDQLKGSATAVISAQQQYSLPNVAPTSVNNSASLSRDGDSCLDAWNSSLMRREK